MLHGLILLGFLSILTAGAGAGWEPLAPGMDLRTLAVHGARAASDSLITVVRIDPRRWDLEFLGLSSTGETSGMTARQWSERQKLAACINAGMFGADYRTHIGYLRFGQHVNCSQVNGYQSVAAFDPKPGKSVPRFRIFDLDAPGVSMQTILADYASAIQNLRLVKRPGSNRWGQQPKKWSEAALGEDSAGRILFIFSRMPLSMHDLNQELLAASIDLVAAQHLEGGPEAQIYVHVGDVELEQFGSYETSFNEDDSSGTPWPIPNVLGVRPRAAAPD